MSEDLTQERFSKETGISRATIAQIEAEKQQPTIDHLSRISLRFGISIDKLVTGRDYRSLNKYTSEEPSQEYVANRKKQAAHRENDEPLMIMVDQSSVKRLEKRLEELEGRVSKLEG